jgi:hypothetical protein
MGKVAKTMKGGAQGKVKVGRGGKKVGAGQTKLLETQRMVLNTWVGREKEGAEALKKRLGKLKTIEDKNAFLERHVISEPPSSLTQKIGKHSQERSVKLDDLAERTVVKTFANHSKALTRTLCIYGYIREQGLEGKAPLSRLLSVEKGPSETTLTFRNEGPDCRQWCPVSAEVWREKRQESADVLRELGLTGPISHHKANSVVKGGVDSRLILIDVGNCQLDVKKTIEMSRKQRVAAKRPFSKSVRA